MVIFQFGTEIRMAYKLTPVLALNSLGNIQRQKQSQMKKIFSPQVFSLVALSALENRAA